MPVHTKEGQKGLQSGRYQGQDVWHAQDEESCCAPSHCCEHRRRLRAWLKTTQAQEALGELSYG